MYLVWTYSIYLAVSISLVIWVATTLRRHGRLFLVAACRNDTELADSLNHLVNVGFYLLSLGYVTLTLQSQGRPGSTQDVIELLSTKEGAVLLVLGAMHFIYVYIISRRRRLAVDVPPFPPDGRIAPNAGA